MRLIARCFTFFLLISIGPNFVFAQKRPRDPLPAARDVVNVVHKVLPGKLFHRGIAASNIEQGSLNDCHLVAAMAAVAQPRPDLIERMVLPTHNKGWYRVVFEGEKTKTSKRFPKSPRTEKSAIVTAEVPYNSYGRRLYAASPSRQTIWTALIEKAYAKYYGGGQGYKKLDKGDLLETSFERLVGGSTQKIKLTPDFFVEKEYREQLWRDLTHAVRKFKPVAVSSPKRKDQHPEGSDVRPWHCFAVTWAGMRNGERMVYLYNPHATHEHRGNHFAMTLKEFNASFTELIISTPKE